MKNNKRQAFTIVELVIVIAVIAILSAVLIPTFGSIIKSANIAADQAEAASVTTHLGMNLKGIKTEADIYNAIKEAYGQDKADTFAPRSAQYGYHYWYDIENNSIILATYKQIENKIATPDNKSEGEGEGAMLTSAVVPVANNDTFAINEKNSFRMFFDKYYIIDNGGSVVGEALNALRTGDDVATKVQALTEVGGFDADDLEDMANALLEKIKTVAIVTNEMTYVYNADSVTSFYFAPGITTISGNVVSNKDYVAKAENFTDAIVIPDTVTKVEQGALMFNVAGAKLQTSLADLEAVSKVFHADSTNATIIAGTDNCTINGGTVTNGSESFDLEYSNKVTSFAIAHPANGSDSHYDGATNTLYVAHNAALSLVAINFEATLDDNTVNTGVIWSVSDGAPFTIDGEGNVTIIVPDKFDGNFNYEGTITATSVTNSEATAEIKVYIVAMRNATVVLDGTTLVLDNTPSTQTPTLTYDGTDATKTFEFDLDSFAPYCTGAYITCCGDVKPTFTSNGNLFSVSSDGKISINTDSEDLNGTQDITVKVGNHIEKTFTIKVVDTSSATFAKKFTNDYLYRVGNAANSTVSLGTLFTSDGTVGNPVVTIYDASKTTINSRGEIADSGDNVFKAVVTPNADWEKTTIQFTGTGVAIVEIKDGENGTPVEIALEVVNGKNVTAASDFSGNTSYVLLNDIDWGTDKDIVISGTIYGNGFAINATTYKPTVSGNTAMFKLNGGTIDNLVINGPVYPEVSYSGETYYVSGIYALGDSKISNSYISGFRQPIMANGTSLYLDNTALVGGNYGNLWLQTGTLTLEDVTTVQTATQTTVGTSGTVLGVGIVVNSGVSASNITIKGALNQYNWVCESDANNMDEDVKSLVSTIFDNTSLTHNVNGTDFINSGILFLGQSGTVNNAEQTNKTNFETVTATGEFMGVDVSAKIYTHASTNGAIASVPTYNGYTPTNQMVLEPTFKYSPTLGTKPTDLTTAKNYNYMENGVVYIGMDTSNETFTLDMSKYAVSKYTSQKITINVDCSGGTVSGNMVTFSAKGNYTITFTIEDNTAYTADGTRLSEPKTYTHTVNVVVANTVIPSAIINVDDVDKTIYMGLEGKTTDTDYAAFFAVLKGLKITDYDENGDPYSVTIPTNSKPTGLTITVSNSEFTKEYTKDNVLYLGDSKANNNNDYTSITVTYKYTGTNKVTVESSVTYTGFTNYIQLYDERKAPTTCVTPDTLITLADGTQKRIDALTYDDQLLVWSFNTGSYDIAKAAALVNHGYDYYEIIELIFSDGTYLRFIGVHGAFSETQNKFVDISADNAEQFIGETFLKQNGNGFESVVLIDVDVRTEYTESWTIVSSVHYNAILNGMLTANPSVIAAFPSYEVPQLEPYEAFELGENMKFDAEKKQDDIDKYGLYTYEEFAEYLSYEKFVAWDIASLKVVVAKGYATYQSVLNYIQIINAFTP